jgi:hypothetical protein
VAMSDPDARTRPATRRDEAAVLAIDEIAAVGLTRFAGHRGYAA